MYRIVITDDEPLERLTVQQALIDYLGDSCTIELAANGNDAIEAAKRVQADIAIMDIEMPGMNGLEASRMIRSEVPDCQIVFLTAYSEFIYVKQALEIGANNFLLKPYADMEICTVIDGVISQIETQRDKKKQHSISVGKVKRLTRWLEEELVLTVLGSYIHPQRLHNRLLELGIKFNSGVCMIMQSPHQLLPRHLRLTLSGYSWPSELRMMMYEYDDRLYIMALCGRDSECIRTICRHVEEILLQEQRLTQKDIYCAVGKMFTNLADAQNSFFHAHTMLAKCSHSQPICIYEELENDMDASYGDLEALLCRSLMSGDTQEALGHAFVLFDWIYAQQNDEQMIAYLLGLRIKKVLRVLEEATGLDFNEIQLLNFNIREPKEERAEKLTRMISNLAAKVSGARTDRISQIRKEIADYMQKNYKADIFLQQVARDMNYSEAYFSKLFKQCFNTNFITYLTEARVEAAKELLRNPTLNIKDIGEQVGYRDNNYFAKVFRRITGKSPSHYRESMLNH